MKKQRKLNLIFLIMLSVVFATFSVANIRAQNDAALKVFKAGDRVEVNVANDVWTQENWVKGTVTEIIYTDDNRILSYKVKQDGSYVQQFGNKARVIRPLKESDGSSGETDATTKKKETQTPTDKMDNSETTGDCSFEKYPEVTSSMKFSEDFIKAELYERYTFEVNTGSLTSPLAVGLTFLDIQIDSPYTNTVTVVPGRGAQRKQDGAPVNAKIYPFKAKYIVCNKYKKEVTQTQYESNFVCFIDKGGNWNCPLDGFPKITHLK